MSGRELSLVLACYDEAPWLESSVREIRIVLDAAGFDWEIVFVDDASRDRTAEIIRRLVAEDASGRLRAVYHERNTGRGRAVTDGIRAATGGVAGFIDVDLEVHPRHIPACFDALRRGAMVAVGVRSFAFVWGGLLRRFLSWGYATLAHALLPLEGIADSEAGCKFFRRAAVLPVLDRVADPGWFWDTEIMVQCRLAGLSITNVPCVFVRNPAKPSTVRIIRDIRESTGKLLAFRSRLARRGSPSRPSAAP